MKLRLFVAIELNEAVRALAARAVEALAESGVVGRFELPEKLHVTVAFLGGLPESQLQDVVQALRDAAAACHRFLLEFDALGAFPNERRPRVLWVGTKRSSGEFTACARRVREAYANLGFTFEHDAQPHVTICRPKFVPSRTLPTLSGSASLPVESLTLLRSLPAGPTTRYEALERTRFPA